VKSNKDEFKRIVQDFIKTQNYERAFKRLASVDGVMGAYMAKNKLNQHNLKEHVISSLNQFPCFKFNVNLGLPISASV
jgi:[histone H4]-N-methyl-L-lysine20 N-methyltransferase